MHKAPIYWTPASSAKVSMVKMLNLL